MNKQVQAIRDEIDKLYAEYKDKFHQHGDQYHLGLIDGLDMAERVLDTLDSEQPEVQNGKFVFPKYLYARTKDNKTIDMSYVPQDMTAVEYIRNDFIEQEQPEVDLEKEIETYFKGWYMDETDQGYILHTQDDHAGLMSVKQVARHFYELGLNTRREE